MNVILNRLNFIRFFLSFIELNKNVNIIILVIELSKSMKVSEILNQHEKGRRQVQTTISLTGMLTVMLVNCEVS